MSNIITCVVFNVVGIGASYFLSLLSGHQKKQVNWGSCVFWGSWVGLLLTYSLWLMVPDKLNVACYITFAIGLVGCVFCFKENELKSFLKSEYFVAFLIIIPFLFIVSYLPRHCDEFSHWVSLPQIFYGQNSLIPQEHWHTGNYTPLWTLQATFFQFFSPKGFDASLIYAVRINLFLSFFFFIKEKFDLTFLKASCLVLGVLIIFFVTKSAQNLLIELPLCLLLSSTPFLTGEMEKNNSRQNLIFFCIALLCLYMLKKPLIAMVPAAFYILWIKGYKKQLGGFILLFGVVYLSWKLKTAHMSEPWQWQHTFKIEGLWSDQAIAVYKILMEKVVGDSVRGLLFVLSMGIMYRRKKEVFFFYLIFSLFYLLGLVATYVYAFGNYYEEAINASYIRYVKIVFVPAYVYALYILLSVSPRLTQWDNALMKRPLPRYTFSFVVPLLFVCFFYPSLYGSHTSVELLYDQLKNQADVKDKKILFINQEAGIEKLNAFRYYAYEETRNIDGGSYRPVADKEGWNIVEKNKFMDQLKSYDIIVVLTSDEWLNAILSDLTHHNMQRLGNLIVEKKANSYWVTTPST